MLETAHCIGAAVTVAVARGSGGAAASQLHLRYSRHLDETDTVDVAAQAGLRPGMVVVMGSRAAGVRSKERGQAMSQMATGRGQREERVVV